MAKRLHDIPTDQFSLNWQNYSDLYDRLEAAERGFARYGHDDLAAAMGNVVVALRGAWEVIQRKERAENG